MVKVEIVNEDKVQQDIPQPAAPGSPIYASSETSRHESTDSLSSIGDEKESFY